jgi:alkanesulfonate monooxygenase SsuD/methylene tetrahydromethanopterin reductase-like flavin-dependent oxidoreductase (luciferase family)
MPRLVLSLEGLRHPPQFTATGQEIYQAAIQIARWADERRFIRVGIGEHHQSDDGYLPAPLVLAAALGAVTSSISVRCSVLLAPLYHPIRLAEEIAVADLCLSGRLEVALGVGYVEADFRVFGADFHHRGDTLDDLLPLLRKAWTGEPFEFRGQTVTVRPRPVQDPFPIKTGGKVLRALRRAVDLADGYVPEGVTDQWDDYRRLLAERGRQDPGPYRRGPSFIWVTDEPKQDVWARLSPYLERQVASYQAWNSNTQVKVYSHSDFSKPGGSYQILTPDETLELARDLGRDGELVFSPLLGGIPPDETWRMLDLVDREVLPSIT